mgnify:CR=1 FL=1
MPVYNSVLLDIDAKETRRYAGLNKAKDFDEKLIEEACLEARLLAEPRGIWQMYDYDAATQTVLADPPFTMKGKLIGKHLAKAQKVIVLSASVGDAIEEHVTKYFADGRYAYRRHGGCRTGSRRDGKSHRAEGCKRRLYDALAIQPRLRRLAARSAARNGTSRRK